MLRVEIDVRYVPIEDIRRQKVQRRLYTGYRKIESPESLLSRLPTGQ